MAQLFSQQNTLQLWRDVEVAVVAAWVAAGAAGPQVLAAVQAAPVPANSAVLAEEQRTRHDVVAFVNVWTSQLDPAVAAWVHRGVTSSDIVDTATGLRLAMASDLLLNAADELVGRLREHALAHRRTVRVGRTHGMHAAPTIWGVRVADFAFAAARCRDRLRAARESVAVAMVSGPVGSYAGLAPELEQQVARTLGLQPSPVSSQVVIRDGIAHWTSCLALLASVCEAIAVEVRHGQRSEVAELAEAFGAGQAGSSAMPHKRNPVTAEKICGLARVVRSYPTPVMEGIALWHERDISHSSVERICLPDAAALTEHLLTSTSGLIQNLVVDGDSMRNTLSSAGDLVFSHAALIVLLEHGMARSEAYPVIQRLAAGAGADGLLAALHAEVSAAGIELDPDSWAAITDLERELAHADVVFDRVSELR